MLHENISIIEILDSESNKETEEDKHNRVDILVKDTKGELIIIEVQNSYALDYFLRILYGISKAIIEHIKEGDPYYKVKKIISVNMVYFDLGHGSDYIYKGDTHFKGLHDDQPLELTAAQRKLFSKQKVNEVFPEIYLIKVNNFDDNAKDTLDEWIYFLKNSEIKKEFSAKGLKKANEVLQIVNMTDEERREYNRFVEVLSDRASIAETIEFESNLKAEEKVAAVLKEPVEKAVGEAVEKAVGEAVQKAVEDAKGKSRIAVEEAVELEKRNTVLNLLQFTTLSDEQIAQSAGVSVEMVRELKAALK